MNKEMLIKALVAQLHGRMSGSCHGCQGCTG